MEWIYLLIAGLLELVWAYTLNLSNGFSILIPTIITIILVLICFFFLEKAIPKLGIGISYAVFTSIGTIGTYIMSILLKQQTLNLGSSISLIILIIGIIGLKQLTSKRSID